MGGLQPARRSLIRSVFNRRELGCLVASRPAKGMIEMKAKLLALFVMAAALFTTGCVAGAGYGGGYYRQGYGSRYYRQGYGNGYNRPGPGVDYRHGRNWDRYKRRNWDGRDRYYDRRGYRY